MRQSNSQSETFRPPLISAGFALIAVCLSHYLYTMSKSGVSIAAPAAIAAGCVATTQAMRAVNDYAKLRHYRKTREQFKIAAKHHGQARFATLEELEQEKLVNNGNRGIFLGQFEGKDIWYDGENSGNFYGPPGTGKTSCTIINTLLSASARTEEEIKTASSFLINDPAFDCYAVTHKALRDAGYDVLVLSSWTDEISEAIGEKVVDAKLNMYSSFDPKVNPAAIRDESKLRTFQLIPNEKPDTEEKTKFFNRGGRSLIECASLWIYSCEQKPNLVNIHKQLMASPAELHELFVKCMESSAFGGYLARLASGLSGIAIGAPEQFAGYLGVAHQALESYDSFSAVGKHVSGPGFDVKRFKGDKPVAVFLIYPGKRAVTHQSMLNAEISFLLEMICADPRHRRVTALIDEAAGLGYVPSLLRFLNEGRKHKLRMFCAWQDLSQGEMIYGKPGMQQILAAGHFLWASGIREPGFCAMLAKIAGTAAIEDMSLNDRSQGAFDIADQSYGLANKGMPLMRDIRTGLKADEALIVYRNLPVIKATKIPYFTRPEWADIAGKNPYVG